MSEWTLRKQFRFEAAHELPHHDGKCKRLHGHSWVGYVVVKAKQLLDSGPQRGMVVDFGVLKDHLRPLLRGKLDHYYLNETLGLENPTSEEVARWVYKELKPKLGNLLHSIVIEETCTSACEYTEG